MYTKYIQYFLYMHIYVKCRRLQQQPTRKLKRNCQDLLRRFHMHIYIYIYVYIYIYIYILSLECADVRTEFSIRVWYRCARFLSQVEDFLFFVFVTAASLTVLLSP